MCSLAHCQELEHSQINMKLERKRIKKKKKGGGDGRKDPHTLGISPDFSRNNTGRRRRKWLNWGERRKNVTLTDYKLRLTLLKKCWLAAQLRSNSLKCLCQMNLFNSLSTADCQLCQHKKKFFSFSQADWTEEQREKNKLQPFNNQIASFLKRYADCTSFRLKLSTLWIRNAQDDPAAASATSCLPF